ncbi:MAG TPA: oligosaccharide flippase family protein [Candidatus Acidoferrum sp.]|nr:oligosaccharide flippase family protein [Candidatus Acidoferrum sp.]
MYSREIAWVGAAQAAAFLGGLATVKTAAVNLGPSEYGKLSAALAIIGIAQICLYGPIAQTATRFLSFAAARNMLRSYEVSLVKLVFVATAIIGLLWALTFTLHLDSWLPLPAAALCVYIVVSGFQMVAVAVCNAGRKRKIVALVQVAEAVVRPTLIFFILKLSVVTAYHALLAYALSSFLLVILIASLWSSAALPLLDVPTSADRSITAGRLTFNMVAFALPFVLFGLLGTVGSHGERLLLASWATWSEVGSYALMSQLVMAPNLLFTGVVNQFYFPLVFQHDPDGTGTIVRSFRVYLFLSVLGIVVITATAATFGDFIIPIFSSKLFLGHEHLLWFLGISAGLFCIGQQLVLPGLRMNKPEIYMPAKFIHSASLLAFSFFLLPRWGVDGMGVASLLASAAYVCAVLLANTWLKRRTNLAVSSE